MRGSWTFAKGTKLELGKERHRLKSIKRKEYQTLVLLEESEVQA